MKHSFALTTRQVAKLGKSEIHSIYMSVKRYGHWRGITPCKTPTGRLIWRCDQVHAALGIVPEPAKMTNEQRFFYQYFEDEALPVTGETWEVVQRLLSSVANEGRDPTLYLNEATLMVEIIQAFTNRLDPVLPIMDETTRKSVNACLTMISQMAESFSEKEADCA